MGWWNVKARDLKFGDELLVPVGMLRVGDVDTGGATGRVAARVRWLDGDDGEWWEDSAPDENLTVRR
jgi:hypothetical protein